MYKLTIKLCASLKRRLKEKQIECVAAQEREGYCHMGYMCHCEGKGFQAVYSSIWYIRAIGSRVAFGSRIGYHFSRN